MDKYEYAAGSSSLYTASKLRILDGQNSWATVSDAKAILNFRYYVKKWRKPILSNPRLMEWHHIVEQHTDNIVKFWANKIHSVENMVLIPWWATWSLHGMISGYYSSIYRS